MKLTEKEVMKVADLAKIDVTSDIKRYSEELNAILTSIKKIEDTIIEGDIMISPLEEQNRFFNEAENVVLSKEEIFKNAINSDEDFIIVPKVREWQNI